MELKKGLEHKEWLRKPRGLRLQEVRDYLLTLHNSLTGGWSQVEVCLRYQLTNNRTGGKGLWFCFRRFRLDSRENFPRSVVQLWHMLPRTVLESLTLVGFKSGVDLALGTWFGGGLGSAGRAVGLRRLFQFYSFCDLVLMGVCAHDLPTGLFSQPLQHHSAKLEDQGLGCSPWSECISWNK